jgi:hypothetical protein
MNLVRTETEAEPKHTKGFEQAAETLGAKLAH